MSEDMRDALRNQDHLHCPQCGYALTGMRTAACPECGLKHVRRQAVVGAFTPQRGLHRFAIILVVTTFGLIMLGGTVTSKGVGLAVPDWPRTYDYNMFLFPPWLWKGGIFWEHTHRLLGSLVGMMSIVMMVWLWLTQRHRPWLRWVGVLLVIAVSVQGVMGGLRVTQLSITWAVIHGITGQLFLCLTVLIAAATGPKWARLLSRAKRRRPVAEAGRLRLVMGVLLVTLVVQLVLGATMRHNDAGLAIPDFPSSYGQFVPPFDQAELEFAMDRTVPYDQLLGYFTPIQVGLHFAHRLWAVVVVVVLLVTAALVASSFRREAELRRPTLILIAMVIVQCALGALVIWTGRHPEMATAHQALGAAFLATAALLAMRIAVRCVASSHHTAISPRHANQPQRTPLTLQGAKA